MKFDNIIMNPPYDNNLHLKIFFAALQHLSDNGTCINLSPANWLGKHSYYSSKYLDFRKVFNGHILNIDIIDHATANGAFNLGNQLENLGVYTAKNTTSSKLDLLKYGFKNLAEFNLITKILQPREGKVVWRNQIFTKFHPKLSSHEVCLNQWSSGKTCLEACVQQKNRRTLVAQFNTEVEKQNFLNSLSTTFMEWYYNTIIKSGYCKIHIYGFMLSDYSQPWDDARFYKFFNITKEEQKIIEDTMEIFRKI